MFTTHCLDASPCTRLVPPRFDGGLVFHTMMTSSARRAVCVHGRAQNKFGCDHWWTPRREPSWRLRGFGGMYRSLHPSRRDSRRPTRRRRHWSGPREDSVQSRTRAGGCGGECAVDRWWQRVSRMNDSKERLNENPGWLMTKRISTKTFCVATHRKQTLCNNLYELRHQSQREWWNAKGNDYHSLTCTCFSCDKCQKWRKDVLGHKQTLFFVVPDSFVRIYEDDLIATSNITAKTKTMFVISWLPQSCYLWLLVFSDDVPRKFLQGLSRRVTSMG